MITDGFLKCPAFVIGGKDCICFLLLCNKLSQTQQLKPTQIYYLAVSLGEKYGHWLTKFSVHGISWLQSRYRMGCMSTEDQDPISSSLLFVESVSKGEAFSF